MEDFDNSRVLKDVLQGTLGDLVSEDQRIKHIIFLEGRDLQQAQHSCMSLDTVVFEVDGQDGQLLQGLLDLHHSFF